jgi:hypothetical protein
VCTVSSFRVEEEDKYPARKSDKKCVLPGFLFSLVNGGSTFLENISELLPDYMASHHRREHS